MANQIIGSLREAAGAAGPVSAPRRVRSSLVPEGSRAAWRLKAHAKTSSSRSPALGRTEPIAFGDLRAPPHPV